MADREGFQSNLPYFLLPTAGEDARRADEGVSTRPWEGARRAGEVVTQRLPLTGFTLIEVLVVVGIFAILATLGLFLSMDFYRGYSFRSERTTLISILEKARARAISNINQAKHGVYVENDQYTIFQGDDYASRTASFDEVVEVNPSVTVTASPSLPLEIVFDRLVGDVSPSGSVTLQQGLNNAVISISSDGQINW